MCTAWQWAQSSGEAAAAIDEQLLTARVPLALMPVSSYRGLEHLSFEDSRLRELGFFGKHSGETSLQHSGT